MGENMLEILCKCSSPRYSRYCEECKYRLTIQTIGAKVTLYIVDTSSDKMAESVTIDANDVRDIIKCLTEWLTEWALTAIEDLDPIQ